MRITIELVNAQGQVINKRSEQLVAGRTLIPLPVVKLSSGSYMMRIYNDKGELMNSQTFIKQ
jgi:hypothetical protein